MRNVGLNLQTLVAAFLLAAIQTIRIEGADMGPNELGIGGVGGVYLLAEPGKLTVQVWKQDLNRHDKQTNLRAILLSPDRKPVGEAVIVDDGLLNDDGPGHIKQIELETDVDQAGIYALSITVTNDRYGENIRWGFRTNCKRYLIETSRGHRDARHVEPIVLVSPDISADVCFAARPREITIDVEGLHGGGHPKLYDAAGSLVADLSSSAEGRASYTLPPGSRGIGPWRLHFPSGQAIVHIDGVTRWDSGEPLENLSLWSPTLDSWFPFHDLRWMLTPYSHVVHAMPGEQRQIELRIHNNGTSIDGFDLAFSEGSLPVELTDHRVELPPDEPRIVTATVSVPPDATVGDTLTTQVSVVSEKHGISTWSRLKVRVGKPDYAIDVPLTYRPYEHENEQFAYTPDYPNTGQLYFAPDNTPYVRVDDGIDRLGPTGWETVDTVDEERYRSVTTKVAFGGDGEICLLGRSPEGVAYLLSEDGGDTFQATPVPPRDTKRQQWDIEQFAGANNPPRLAPFVRATETGEYDPNNFWRHVNDLELFLPERIAGKVFIGDPILLSTQAIGISSHSGIPSALASQGDRVHIIWGEATDPDGHEPGVPAYVATYDRNKKSLLGKKAFVGFGPPANDVHNTPSIVIDSQGYLHTLTGTHGQPFAYARSVEPHTAHAGFTEPELVENDLRSTYIGFVCDSNDTLHLVFRTWKSDGEYHPEGYYANLAYKRKHRDRPWEPMKRLAVAPFTEYSIWYHRLTIDRNDRLFVSFDYWSTFWFYRVDHYGNSPGRGRAGGGGRRKTILSSDGGDSWKLLETNDL